MLYNRLNITFNCAQLIPVGGETRIARFNAFAARLFRPGLAASRADHSFPEQPTTVVGRPYDLLNYTPTGKPTEIGKRTPGRLQAFECLKLLLKRLKWLKNNNNNNRF